MTRYAVAPSFLHVHLLTRMFFHVTQSRIPRPSSPPHTRRAHSFDIHLLVTAASLLKATSSHPCLLPRYRASPLPGPASPCSAVRSRLSPSRGTGVVSHAPPLTGCPPGSARRPAQPPPCTPVLGSDSPAWAVCRVGFLLTPPLLRHVTCDRPSPMCRGSPHPALLQRSAPGSDTKRRHPSRPPESPVSQSGNLQLSRGHGLNTESMCAGWQCWFLAEGEGSDPFANLQKDGSRTVWRWIPVEGIGINSWFSVYTY